MVMGDLPTETDVLVIGGGPGGYVAALRAAALGKKVTLVERDRLGGTCLHYGCIPSKTLIHAASLVDEATHSEEIGISAKVTVDPVKLRAFKQRVIDRLTRGIELLCKKRGVTVVQGSASFESPNRAVILLSDGKQGIEFSKAIIATGSKSAEIPHLPFSHKKIWSAKEALDLPEIPKNLAVVGAGYIGLELGFMYAKLGTKVTLVEAMPDFLPSVDKETRDLLHKRLKSLGVTLMLGTKAEGIDETGKQPVLKTSGGDVAADFVLVCVGLKPYHAELNIAAARVEVDAKGFVKTNESMQTTQPHIYAVGDVRGMPFLAHKAFYDGKVAAEHLCGQNTAFIAKTIPSVMFCDPEVASAGLTEEEAKKQGFEVKTAKFPFQASGRALSMNATEGFVKVVAGKDNTVLGVQIVGPDAGELIGEAVLAIEMGASAEDLALTIHPHPTLSEALEEAMENLLGKGVHS